MKATAMEGSFSNLRLCSASVIRLEMIVLTCLTASSHWKDIIICLISQSLPQLLIVMSHIKDCSLSAGRCWRGAESPWSTIILFKAGQFMKKSSHDKHQICQLVEISGWIKIGKLFHYTGMLKKAFQKF